ncbi:hypothetical protein COK01_26825 [Priestia megaterium]|uniref:helix-turn-helix transcriptional regulator n=1 Tax=Priestia megaterium TaxID=1404 RepID=UPI000BF7141C|nr:YafY family protein [Priestia megaterium]PFP44702.1 hypothetical protein COK01_26825 [Priestia megaterium]
MNKSERIIKLWLYINKKRNFTAGELADQFHVSIRTIHRDLEYLSELGVPLYSDQGRYGGFRLLNNTLLPPITFSEEEIASIMFTYEALKFFNETPYKAESTHVKEKLLQQLPSVTKDRIHSIENHVALLIPNRKKESPFLKEIFNSSIQKKGGLLSYEKNRKNELFKIIPIGIYAFNGFWYFVAWDFELDGYKIFRSDRVVDYQVDDNIKQPKGLYTLTQWFHSIEGKLYEEKIILEVTAQGYRTITNKWLLEAEQTWKGNCVILTVHCPKSQIKFVIPQILQLGSQAKVIYPESIKNKIIEEIKNMFNSYSGNE